MATQMMDEAEALCDRIVIIDAGRVVAEGGVSDLLERYAGQGSISFKTTSRVDAATLKNLPGVIWASTRRVGASTSVRLVVSDMTRARAAVRASSSIRAQRVKTAGPSLSDVFLRLVGKELDEQTREED